MPAPAPVVPGDDLYARLELGSDASPEAIELAWRALLKRHHPDVAGDSEAALTRAKQINVAHDWLSDSTLRSRYDAERAGTAWGGGSGRAGGGAGGGRGRGDRTRVHEAPWRRQHGATARGARGARVSTRPDLTRGEPAERLARFLARVDRLTLDELDRLAAAEPPPIAFLATVRRFLPADALAAFAAAEAELAARVPAGRWTSTGVREGLLGVAAELVLAPFLDETLGDPFRGRARDRLLRAWEVSLEQPRHGPNGAAVAALRTCVAALQPAQVMAFLRASHGVEAGELPWPAALDVDADEALRISAELAAADVADAMPADGLSPSAATRARRLMARLGYATALRHAFTADVWARLAAPLDAVAGTADPAPAGPEVRRAR